MSLPDSLTSRYFQPRLVVETGRSEIWHVRDNVGNQWAVKLLAAQYLGDQRIADAVSHLPHAHEHFVVPETVGVAGDGREYQVMAWYPGGDLRSWLATRSDRGAEADQGECRAFIAQAANFLNVLHSTDDNGEHLVHGDLKPSNILLFEPSDGQQRRFRLADFDATFIEGEPSRGFTLTYAAPEVLAGAPRGIAADFWALGMIVLEWLTGSHPFAELDEAAIRRLVGCDWHVDVDHIDGDAWRALLYGLFDRNPVTRWGGDDLRRWLADDSAAISSGLARGRESRADMPFDVHGSPAHTARTLASLLIADWATDLVAGGTLPDWLQGDLQRPDMAAYLRRLQRDPGISDDMLLLRFCFRIDASLPHTWRRESLTAPNIDAIASRAADIHAEGRADALEWLRSMQDGQCADFYRSLGADATAALGDRLLGAWRDFREAWEALCAAGAPPPEPLPEDVSLPLPVRAAFSDAMKGELAAYAQRLNDAPHVLFGDSWMHSLGMPYSSLSPVRLAVLQQFIPLVSSRQMGGNPIGGDQVWSSLQRRLYEMCRIRQDAQRIVLLPGQSYPPGEEVRVDWYWDSFRNNAARQTSRGIRRVVGYLGSLAIRSVAWVTRSAHRGRGDGSATIRRLTEWSAGRGRHAQQRPQVFFEVRLLPLVVDAADVTEAERATTTAYLALISWRAPDNLRLRLKVINIGAAIPVPRLISPVLPSHGQYPMVISGNSRLWLDMRRRRFSFGWRTEPISIWLPPPPRMAQVTNSIVPPDLAQAIIGIDSLQSSSQKILAVKDKIVAPEVFKQDVGTWKKRLQTPRAPRTVSPPLSPAAANTSATPGQRTNQVRRDAPLSNEVGALGQ